MEHDCCLVVADLKLVIVMGLSKRDVYLIIRSFFSRSHWDFEFRNIFLNNFHFCFLRDVWL